MLHSIFLLETALAVIFKHGILRFLSYCGVKMKKNLDLDSVLRPTSAYLEKETETKVDTVVE